MTKTKRVLSDAQVKALAKGRAKLAENRAKKQKGGNPAVLGAVTAVSGAVGEISKTVGIASNNNLKRQEKSGVLDRRASRNARFASRKNDANQFIRFDYLKKELKQRGLYKSDAQVWNMVHTEM